MRTETKHSALLMLTALIWGLAFVAQSVGAGLGPYTFLACRSWLALVVIAPVVAFSDRKRLKEGKPSGRPVDTQAKKDLWLGGTACGAFLFAASAAQQIAITLNPSTAKASFITAMYVVLVPVAGIFLGRRCEPQIWLCVLGVVGGLYLLCMGSGFGGLEASDMVLMLCALLFTGQILCVDHFAPRVDGVRLSLLQFGTTAVLATVGMLLFETPTLAALQANLLPVAYCGIFSSGVAYTLQIIGQREVNPAVASIIMCLESVFGALGGWLILGQTLTLREGAGCALIFGAVVLAQLPLRQLLRAKG